MLGFFHRIVVWFLVIQFLLKFILFFVMPIQRVEHFLHIVVPLTIDSLVIDLNVLNHFIWEQFDVIFHWFHFPVCSKNFSYWVYFQWIDLFGKWVDFLSFEDSPPFLSIPKWTKSVLQFSCLLWVISDPCWTISSPFAFQSPIVFAQFLRIFLHIIFILENREF